MNEQVFQLMLKKQEEVFELQQKTFDKLDTLTKEFSEHKTPCEQRFTKLETKAKFKLRLYSAIATIIGTVIGWFMPDIKF